MSVAGINLTVTASMIFVFRFQCYGTDFYFLLPGQQKESNKEKCLGREKFLQNNFTSLAASTKVTRPAFDACVNFTRFAGRVPRTRRRSLPFVLLGIFRKALASDSMLL